MLNQKKQENSDKETKKKTKAVFELNLNHENKMK